MEVAGDGGDDAVGVVGDPVGFVVVEEFNGRFRPYTQPNIVTTRLGVGTIIFIPAVVECRFILPASGRHVKNGLPHIIGGIIGQMGVGAFGLPVAGAAQFIL